MGNSRNERRRKLRYYLKCNTLVKDTDAPDRCFICYGENNIQSSNICCGTTYYHQECFDKYCNQSGQYCQICHNDISDKLLVNEISYFDVNKCIKSLYKVIKTVLWILSIILYGYICMGSMDAYDKLYCKFNEKYCDDSDDSFIMRFRLLKIDWIIFYILPLFTLVILDRYWKFTNNAINNICKNSIILSLTFTLLIPVQIFCASHIPMYISQPISKQVEISLDDIGMKSTYGSIRWMYICLSWMGIVINILCTIYCVMADIIQYTFYDNDTYSKRYLNTFITKFDDMLKNMYNLTHESKLRYKVME